VINGCHIIRQFGVDLLNTRLRRMGYPYHYDPKRLSSSKPAQFPMIPVRNRIISPIISQTEVLTSFGFVISTDFRSSKNSKLRMQSTPLADTPEAKALRALADAGYANLRVSDLARLLPPDSFEEELSVMADVRAYYHVAYKVNLARHLRFNVLIAPSSASLTIFLSRSSMLSIMLWRDNFRRVFSRAC
jgi:hypothetical protein